ncbi:MAG: pyridoxal-phosphate dependent enzyme [Akkermansia sp.]|nr:pyridoxal-phosphate dependent enzyme [Akkermansia sp.]
MSTLKDQLFDEILQARQRVYAVGSPTPLQQVLLPEIPATIYAKREDLGPIKAYKWRGAFNCMSKLTPEQRAKGVVAASAGNHGQGVALAASRLDCHAYIFMPRSTPTVKQESVRRHGGEHVEIVLTGDSYDAASAAAHEFAEERGLTFVHPYDDLATMGGQGTLADEVVMSGKGPFTRVYLQIGGGGLASGCACWFKRFWPDCKCIGVEGEEQASMKLAVETGERGVLKRVDVFCDGTAVRQAGENTFPLCRELLDEYRTVSNEEVCCAIRGLWNSLRVVPEPSGAMGLAALMQDWESGKITAEDRCLVVISGANMDFSQLGVVSRLAGVQVSNLKERYLRIPMETKRRHIQKYLEHIPAGVQLTDVQFGRTDSPYQYPVFGLLATREQYAEIERRLADKGLKPVDASKDVDVRYRMISYDRKLLNLPAFYVIDFPERPGAFTEFMGTVGKYATLFYFNYHYSGESVGRALVGLDYDSPEEKDACETAVLAMHGSTIQGMSEVAGYHNMPFTPERLVLASASPRRRELLEREGVKFLVVARHVDEWVDPALAPEEICMRNAALKAEAVALDFQQQVVVGADTMVFLDGKPYGKPVDEDDAVRMLTELQGRTHSVCTGVAVIMPHGERRDFSVTSRVTFRPLTEEQIRDYIRQVYVMDKAGAYAIQEKSELIVEKVEGDLDNVIGLPVKKLLEVLS